MVCTKKNGTIKKYKLARIDGYSEQTFTRPNLTSNGTLGGDSFAVRATGPFGNNAYMAVDGDEYNSYSINANESATYTFYNPYLLNVTQISLSRLYSGYAISITNIDGSNDNSNWYNITFTATPDMKSNDCQLSNTEFYKYYRISYTENSNDNYIGEIYITATEKKPVVKTYTLARKKNDFHTTSPLEWTTPVLNSNISGFYSQKGIFANGMYMYLNKYGSISYSTDFINWSSVALSGSTWTGIAYGNNIFVALRQDGYVSTSTNGTTWSAPVQISTFSGRYMNSLCYGNGIFCACSASTLYTSTNGINWTSKQTIAVVSYSANYQSALCYGNGVFVLYGEVAGLQISTDNWETKQTGITLPSGYGTYSYSLIYGDGYFVTTSGNTYIHTSRDGLNWSTPTQVSELQNISTTWGGLLFDNTNFIILSNNNYLSKSKLNYYIKRYI